MSEVIRNRSQLAKLRIAFTTPVKKPALARVQTWRNAAPGSPSWAPAQPHAPSLALAVPNDSVTLFITGVTGFLGKATLAHLIMEARYKRLFLLIRGRDAAVTQQRLVTLATEILGPDASRFMHKLVAVRGDLAEPGLGLSPADRQTLVRELDGILHIGASTDFGASLETSRQMNVEGTRMVVDLALEARQAGKLRRFDYVSTAFVAGTKAGIVQEQDLSRGQRFANTYEQSKFEAETLVRRHAAELPTAIYRPSIVVGDSQNGYTPHFKVLYWPLRLLSLKSLRVGFLNKRARLDIVPVDFVVRGMVALLEQGWSVGGCYHLTAGWNLQVKASRVLNSALRYIGGRRVPMFPFWARDLLRRTPLRRLLPAQYWEIAALAAPYDGYFRGDGARFDSRATDRLLLKLGINRQPWRAYEEQILSFCRLSRWGRKLPRPVHEYYQHLQRDPS